MKNRVCVTAATAAAVLVTCFAPPPPPPLCWLLALLQETKPPTRYSCMLRLMRHGALQLLHVRVLLCFYLWTWAFSFLESSSSFHFLSTSLLWSSFSRRIGSSNRKVHMAPRWKGKDAKAKKDAEAEALKEPMSKIVSQLQSSLVQSDTRGFLSDNSVHLAVGEEQLDLLDKACFGRPVRTVEKDKHWFQLSFEEAFYLCDSLKCLKINGSDTGPQNEELWNYMKSQKEAFPYFYKAYSHLRLKNWVVRSGAQYGVDFVVYRHHPGRVHSEYGVLVLSDEDDKDLNGRLEVWSDFHCTTRLLGSVAKFLLVLYVNKNGNGNESPLCLSNYTVEERTITRWSPEQSREKIVGKHVSKHVVHHIDTAEVLIISRRKLSRDVAKLEAVSVGPLPKQF
ncbi:hypothetical protein VNO78_17158 [Psophocarpus tetragonolobus]|uniref:tRNA-intron lyase n=1 Tax=Psophocarpus tetragonolobus TaxID=3891 RepID=A0AAN9SGJ2_PSOTE